MKPYTDTTVEELAQKGIKNIDVFCPGFISDCLETLEEINIQLRQTFKENGGEIFNYIDCLNDKNESIENIKKDVKFIEIQNEEPLKRECIHFLEVLRGQSPNTDGKEGLDVIKVISQVSSEANFKN